MPLHRSSGNPWPASAQANYGFSSSVGWLTQNELAVGARSEAVGARVLFKKPSEGFDKGKLQNGILDPLRESDLIK